MATTTKDINNLSALLYGQGTTDIKEPQQLKSELFSEVTKAKAAVKAKAEATKSEYTPWPYKKFFKWVLGSLVSGVLFISIWLVSSKLV